MYKNQGKIIVPPIKMRSPGEWQEIESSKGKPVKPSKSVEEELAETDPSRLMPLETLGEFFED